MTDTDDILKLADSLEASIPVRGHEDVVCVDPIRENAGAVVRELVDALEHCHAVGSPETQHIVRSALERTTKLAIEEGE